MFVKRDSIEIFKGYGKKIKTYCKWIIDYPVSIILL